MSVSEHPAEPPLADFAAHVHGDLPGRVAELGGAAADAERDLAAAMDRAQRVRDGFGRIAGRGEAEHGAVRVTVDASGCLVDIHFTPAVLRFGSVQRLRDAVKDAAADAADDAAAQYRDLAGVGPDGIPDPLGDFLGGMPEVTRMLPPELISRLRGQSAPHADEPIARRAKRDPGEGPGPYEP
ncbi:YbaB/EbfC family nucleoid-associated protein [Propionicicella superfundia]|uniref:YbaB/EbfC family nucleoid-associated protein n=1 Tax=Propionicicella superfundia TaxID=348582 RepID=UPI0003F9EF5A|nr:YbaB/EbfC family nucleoid-associated protein [Propionicicella superfundia]